MNEKPILFSTSMVRAILEDRKTQTRRVMKPQPSPEFNPIAVEWFAPTVEDRYGYEQPGKEIFGCYGEEEGYKCPYGAPGDQLWVREKFGTVGDSFVYFADYQDGGKNADAFVEINTGKTAPILWKSSFFLPRKASRIQLEIVKVRVEKVQDISKDDATAEGVPGEKFRELWDSINFKDGNGWNANPWVWVIEFKRIKP